MINEFIEQINRIDKKEKNIDIIIISAGGDPMSSYRLINILRERFDNIGVLIPSIAYSAATLFALGADEIIMLPFSNLGPVDPQLTYKSKDENMGLKQFGTEDLRNYLEFLKQDIGLTDQNELMRAFELICNEVGAVSIGRAKRGGHLILSLGEKLLTSHIKDKNKAKTIVETLNKLYDHGYPLSRKESIEIGLPIIKKMDEELEKILWDIFKDIETEMKCSQAFSPVQELLNSESGKKLLIPTKQVNIPTGLPVDELNKIYQNILSQISVVDIEPIDYEIFMETIESKNSRSELRSKGKIFGRRLPNNNIETNILHINLEWKLIN